MSFSTLYPPNIERLGDAMVGDVRQRVNLANRGFYDAIDAAASSENYPPTLTGNTQLFQPADGRHPTASSGTSHPTKLRPDARRSSSKDQPARGEQALSVEETKLRIHRNRRRIYQQRYRKKLYGRETTYEEEVAQLGGEIRKLQQHRQLVLSGIPTQPTSWQVVAEYYSLFRNGLKPLVVTSDVSSEYVQETHVQKRFLQANMAPDVATNTGFGVSTLLAEWERLRVCYPDLRVKLVGMNYSDGDAVIAVSQRFVTITEQTLRNAFQHLISGERWSPLAAKLLGRRLVVSITTHFEWDQASAQISSVHSITDIVTPLLKLLGNLEDVANVLQNPFLQQ